MIEVRQARYFIAVAEELHFGHAAVRLQMSQPPLSQAIKQLESQLGCELLHRTQRSVALLPAGVVFLDQCRTLVRQAENATLITRRAAAGRGGRLSIGAVTSAFAWPLPQTIARYHAAAPDTEVRAREIDSHEAARGLLDHTLDLAVVRQTAAVHGTIATPLFTDRFVAALPADHLAADTSEPLDLAALAGDTWIWLNRQISPDYHDAMAALCRAAGFSPIPAHWARSVTSQIAMVDCGLGVAIVPSAAAAAPHGARFRPLQNDAATIVLTILTRDNPGEAVRRFSTLTTDIARESDST